MTPAVQATAESTTVVENELYRITFSNRGGQVTSWILKRTSDEDGKPLDLVDHAASAKFGYPMSLYTYDPALTQTLANAMYVPSATGSSRSAGDTDVPLCGQRAGCNEDLQLRPGLPDPRRHAGAEGRQPGAGAALVAFRHGRSRHCAHDARDTRTLRIIRSTRCRAVRTSTSPRRRSPAERR